MKYTIAILLIATASLISACSQTNDTNQQNLTKKEILRVADEVDEIRVQAIDYSRPGKDIPYELRLVHRYVKGNADFREFLDALKNSVDEGSYARAIGNRRIILRGHDKILMRLGGYSGSGQFAWSTLEGMRSRNNHVYLLPKDRKFAE